MARYTGPSFKKSRTVGFSTLENGKELARRPYKPGQHGPTSRGSSSSDYAKQMRAKQTLKGYYGNIGEKKFHAS